MSVEKEASLTRAKAFSIKSEPGKVWGHDDICAVIEKYQTRENPATQVFCNATFEFVTTSIAGVAVHKSEDNVIVLSTGERIEF